MIKPPSAAFLLPACCEATNLAVFFLSKQGFAIAFGEFDCYDSRLGKVPIV
jgi:hypothetical protein